MIKVFTDGGARGNPGPSAVGVFIADDNDNIIAGFGKPMGVSTNNVAEYQAVIAALDWFLENQNIVQNHDSISFFVDAQLICAQINGVFKVKNSNLRTLLFEIRQKEAMLNKPVRYAYIPREGNKKADKLVNMALDKNSYVFYNKV